MKRTILSSFVLLYPLNKAYQYRDVTTMNLSAIGLALSVCNHSHHRHTDSVRKKIFRWLDVVFMHAFIFRTLYNSLSSAQCVAGSTIIASLMTDLYYYNLGSTRVEDYTRLQKNVHVFFHLFSVTALTMLHERCFWGVRQINAYDV